MVSQRDQRISPARVELQYEMAREGAGHNGSSQILWMPKDLASYDERQRKFIDLILQQRCGSVERPAGRTEGFHSRQIESAEDAA